MKAVLLCFASTLLSSCVFVPQVVSHYDEACQIESRQMVLAAEPLTAKVRSMSKPVPVRVEGPLGEDASVTLRFENPEYGVAPGQAAVIYAGERVVGGGWIAETDGASIGA